jgi:hypothetical protein
MALSFAGCSTATDVTITSDRQGFHNCTFVGNASADSFKNLQRKAARLGGNVAVASRQPNLVGPVQGLEFIVLDYGYAEVFQCEK